MIKNYLLVALRNILKNKMFSFINIIGLSIGMACSILILLWIMNELSYDQFHEKKDNIYRVTINVNLANGEKFNSRRLPYNLGDAIKDQLPEIVNITRFSRGERTPIIKGDISFYENTIVYANPSLLEMFTFPIIKGDKNNLFPDIRSIVISERWAKKYFGDENPIGQQLNWNNWQKYTITGVIKNVPENSHINFDLITKFDIWKRAWPPAFEWDNFTHNIYVEVIDDVNISELEKKIEKILFSNTTKQSMINYIKLQPLTDIHFTTNIGNEYAKVTDIEYVYIYSLIAILILVIACINYINLTTAKSVQRSLEIGIRKTLGAERNKVIGQFLTESFMITIVAYILAMMFVEFFIPSFNLLVGKNLEVQYLDPFFLSLVFIILLVTTLLAGGYPAFFLSSVKPVKVLKGVFNSGKGNGKLRKILVIIQFSISVFLLTGTIGIYLQMEFMSNKKLGFEKEGVVYLPNKGNISKKYEQFKTELVQNNKIKNVTIKNSIPISNQNSFAVNWEGKKTAERVILKTETVGYDYFKTMGIKLLAGRTFNKSFTFDKKGSVIIDENAAKRMEFSEPIGKVITISDAQFKIVGLTNETNFLSLQQKAEPRIYLLDTEYTSNIWNLYGVILIKIDKQNVNESISYIKKCWKEINPQTPFDINFLDESYNKFYASEQQTVKTLGYFTILAVLISCLGLFGLVAFTLEQKRKEIAIKKTFGASDWVLSWEFVKSFSNLVLVAFLIAVGPAYYLLQIWLNGYAYHVEPGAGLFIGVGMILMTITVLTVGVNSLKTTRKNPVKNLREE